jgi:hypothetical protein
LLSGCGGTPSAGPSPIAVAPPPGTVTQPGAPTTLPAGLDPAYVRAIATLDAAGHPKRWEGGPFHHCIGAGVDPAIVAEAAATMSEITGVQRTDVGPCNVTWVVEFVSSSQNASAVLAGTATSITSARVRFVSERAIIASLANHEAGHVLGLNHSTQQGDLMCSPPAEGDGNPCAPFPSTFAPRERAVLAWMYGR